MKQKEKVENSLISGSIVKGIITFAIPIFFGNLFQQLYNTADSLIVGNFLGSDDLAAVTSSGSLIFLLVGFFSGIALGAGVVISRYYGAGDYEKVSLAIHTEIAFAIIASILMTILGVWLTPQILGLMGTPAQVLPKSVWYFRLYFLGSIAVVLYNAGTGILQAVGDSRHPLYYLVLSSILNIVLDLIFIGAFHLGVGSAAVATVISQAFSAILCMRRLLYTDAVYKVYFSKIKINKEMLKQIIGIGIPSGMQNSIIAFANIIVQSNINAFDVMAVAGCGVYAKIEGFAFLPITCFAMSLTTFIGQNLGSKQYKRAKSGARFGIICSMILAELVGIFMYFMMPVLVSAFNQDPNVIYYGTRQAHIETMFYLFLAFSHCIAGILRGAGKSTVPMIVMLVCWCLIRITYITTVIRFIPKIEVVFTAYPLTWTLSSILFLIYYLKADWVHSFEKKN